MIDDMVQKRFTVLQTNIARRGGQDRFGRRPFDERARREQEKRWNTVFFQGVDAKFDYANDKGIYLFINGVVDFNLIREAKGAFLEQLVKMVAARYAGHHISWSSSMDDPFSPLQHDINAWIDDVVGTQKLLSQHPGTAPGEHGTNADTAFEYYDELYQDYVMFAGGAGGFDQGRHRPSPRPSHAAERIVSGSRQLYHHEPHKPLIFGETNYDGLSAWPEQSILYGWWGLFNGNAGYTYGNNFWGVQDNKLRDWMQTPGSFLMRHMRHIYERIDGGRALVPRPDLVRDDPPPLGRLGRIQHDVFNHVAVSESGKTVAALLPAGGEVAINLASVPGRLSATWYEVLTGASIASGTVAGHAVRTFTSPYGNAPAIVVLGGRDPVDPLPPIDDDRKEPEPQPPPSTDNRVANGGMEEGLWRHGSFAGLTPAFAWSDIARSGHRSAQVHCDDCYGWMMTHHFPVEARTRYKVTTWMLTDQLDTNAVTVHLWWLDKSGARLSRSESVGGKVGGTHDWTTLVGSVTAPRNATQAFLSIRVKSAQGTAWIDDVTVVNVP